MDRIDNPASMILAWLYTTVIDAEISAELQGCLDYIAAGLDPKSPHDTQGLKIKWDNAGDKLEFTIPPAHKDISVYSAHQEHPRGVFIGHF